LDNQDFHRFGKLSLELLDALLEYALLARLRAVFQE